ncbi:MAG: HAMP domain-containing sensor histidine kinase [Gemmatimonadaceae bacterium]
MHVDLDVPTQDVLTRLSQHRLLGDAPITEHEWLAAHGVMCVYPVGSVVTSKNEPAALLLVLFAGHLVMRADRAAGAHKVFEWKAGEVGGVVPYSRVTSPPFDVVVEDTAEALAIEKRWLAEMIRDCPVTTARLVHVMLDRVRQFKASEIHDEKMVSLGKLAAGLAHELNNPASAVVRSAKMLIEGLGRAEAASRLLASATLSDEQFAAIDRARAMCEAAQDAVPRSPVERADREDELTDWLADHRATEEYAIPLADSGITPSALDMLAEKVHGDALEAALGWISECVLVRALAGEIETASLRIHGLVSAVKGFSGMDHAHAPEPVDIRRGIADTFMMLGAKLRTKKVVVSVDIPDDLPRAHAVSAELNQVWMNLIDNAFDAVAPGGHVTVVATRERGDIVVKVIDDGPGVPAEVRHRIFEPFVSTKGVGKGTGLGLDIAKRLLMRQDGGLSFESVPGRTEFQVRLPAES